jgi:hypothetical protein
MGNKLCGGISMKQNKRFILLVVMVLLANCLFAGLASADTAETAVVQNMYYRDVNWDGSSASTTTTFTKNLAYGKIGTDSNKTISDNIAQAITLHVVTAGATNYDKPSDATTGDVYVAVTFAKGLTNGFPTEFKVTTSDKDAVEIKDVTANSTTKKSVTVGNTTAGTPVDADNKVDLLIKRAGGATVTVQFPDELGAYTSSNAKSLAVTLKAANIAPKEISAERTAKAAKAGSTYKWNELFTVSSKTTGADVSKDTLTYTSSDTTVATINENKDITILKGDAKAEITVSSTLGGKPTTKITIETKKADAAKPVTKIEFTASKLDFDTYAVSGELNLGSFVKTTPASGYDTPKSKVWTIDNDKIATVSDGKVKPTSNAINGDVKVVYTIVNADGSVVKSDDITVTFNKKVSVLDKVKMYPEKVTMYYVDKDVSSTTTLYATAMSDKDISDDMKWSWKTSDPSVVVFESTGLDNAISLKATGAGVATITAIADDGKITKEATATVTVTGTASELIVEDANKETSSTVYLKKDKTSTLKLKASKAAVTWTSEKPEIAEVKDGVVTIKAKGKVHIYATDASGNVATYGINAKQAKAKIKVDTKTVAKGDKVQLFTIDENAYDKTATVTVEDPKIVKVSASGKMTGKSVGSTKVTVKTADYTKTIKVKVTK